jgi:hypothetical protein
MHVFILFSLGMYVEGKVPNPDDIRPTHHPSAEPTLTPQPTATYYPTVVPTISHVPTPKPTM